MLLGAIRWGVLNGGEIARSRFRIARRFGPMRHEGFRASRAGRRSAYDPCGMFAEDPAHFADHLRVLNAAVVRPDDELGPGARQPGAGDGDDAIGLFVGGRAAHRRDDRVGRECRRGTRPFQVLKDRVLPGELVDARRGAKGSGITSSRSLGD